MGAASKEDLISKARNPATPVTHIRAVVITASDACSRGEREDASSKALVQLLTEMGAQIVAKEIVSDDLWPKSCAPMPINPT